MATKKILVVPATATLLLLLLSLSPNPTTANAVLDVEGNPLDVESKYYIQPVGLGVFRGGLRRSSRLGIDLGCPLYVTESSSEVDPGEPVKFIPDEKTQEGGAESAYYIDSGLACGSSHGIWYMSGDELTGKSVFLATGADDITLLSAFKMHRVETNNGGAVYKMFTCVSIKQLPVCGYVGLFIDPITRLKMLTFGTDAEAHLNVEFIKKPTNTLAYAAAN